MDRVFLFLMLLPRDVLLSQDPAVQVPSALESLTSVFEMGTGVTFPPSSRDCDNWVEQLCEFKTVYCVG
jgi:hypothetical protein